MFPVVGYFNALSILAQTSATLRLGVSRSRECRPAALLDKRVLPPRVDRLEFDQSGLGLGGSWNLSTQIGASAVTTALLAL